MLSDIIPEGFKDDVQHTLTEHNFKNTIINYFQSNGFFLVKTPLLEYSNKDTGTNTFKIVSKKNEKKLNIRDDITMQVARLSQTRLSKKTMPFKLCYYGEVVRKNGTMLRPERQFLQIGAECIGENSFLADVEILELAYKSLNLVGIKDITLEISSRVFLDRFFYKIKNSPKKDEIKRLIRLKDIASILDILETKYHKFLKDIFSCTGSYKNKKNNLKKLKVDNLTSKEVSNIDTIMSNFLKRNSKINIFLDLSEIDKKYYHSGLRFTFFSKNIRGEIAQGGRYLVSKDDKKIIATGFTCYMDSLLRASSTTILHKKILVPFNISKKNLQLFIKKGYSILRYTGEKNINKKLARNQKCQFYLENNKIKKT